MTCLKYHIGHIVILVLKTDLDIYGMHFLFIPIYTEEKRNKLCGFPVKEEKGIFNFIILKIEQIIS